MVARIMTFGRQDRKFPVNKAQFKPYCKEQLNMIARLEDYKSSCLKDRSKQTVAIIIYSMKNVVGTYCRNPNSKRTTELINSASCANEATTEYARCNSEYIDLLLAVENSKDAKQQLVQLCCGYVEVFKCIRSSAASLAGCTESQVEANVNYIRGFFDNASNLICSDYSAESDKCDRVKLLKRKGIRPPPPANSNNAWSQQSSFSRPQSYFNPLVHLLSSL